jgi:hypothetical protein
LSHSVTHGHEICRRQKEALQLLQQSTTICRYRSTLILICQYPSCGACYWFQTCLQNRVPPSHKQHILKITAAGSSVTAHSFALTMERLFSPCTRFHDMLESQGHRGRPEGFHEWAFTYSDLYATTGNEDTVRWLTPHAAVGREGSGAGYFSRYLDESCLFNFSADGKQLVAWARSTEHLLEICDVVVRLLAASVVHSVSLTTCSSRDDVLINAPTLAYLMEQCQSLKFLSLHDMEMDDDHCRVLGAYTRPDLEIVLSHCKLTSAGTRALAEVFGRNQGPTKLHSCYIDYSVLADGLRGNSRLKSLVPRFSRNLEDDERELLAIAFALRENKGLVGLNFDCTMSDEPWDAICDSLKTHPTLEILHLSSNAPAPAPAVIKSRLQALLDMMKVNMSIHAIHVSSRYSEHEVFRGSVIPYLETNLLRLRVRAIQTTRPTTYRAKVLGRALLAVRTDANSFWMLLSGNPEVAFPSRTTTVAAAANLPTPTTATSTANVAAVAASVMSALTTTTTGSLPAASAATSATTPSVPDAFVPSVAPDANAATPPANLKRKER